MKVLATLEVPRGKRPLYLRIAEGLRAAVRAGRLRAGEPLPSTRELAGELAARLRTVAAALEELASEGWLELRPRAAARVSPTLPSRFFEAAAAPRPASPRVHGWRIARAPQLDPLASSRYPFKHNFVVGPDLRLFPYEEFKSHFADALRRSGPRLFDYGDPLGQGSLIEELQTYLRRVRAVTGRRVVVTHGSQEGIFLAAQVLVRPGDEVAVEALGYRPAFAAFEAAGARLVPVRVDGEGLDVEHLEALTRARRIRLLYCTPLHHYPTTATLPMARRLRLYELAARRGIGIIEDDYDHEYHYRSQPLPPLASADPAGLVVYVSTFSKVFAPSARVGFLAIPPALAPAIAAYRRIVTRQSDALLQDAIARWMRDGGFERHLRRTRRLYEQRRDAAVAALEHGRRRGLPLSWDVPHGGMALWIGTGRESRAAAAAAEKRGIYVSPEAEHWLRPPAKPGDHLRVGFAGRSPAELRAGLGELFDALETVRPQAR